MLVKKISAAFVSLFLFTVGSKAQLIIQSGATFTMQTAAQVTVQGSVDNAGAINNDGSLRVQGNFTNSGTYTGVGTTGILEIYGSGSSDLNVGNATIANLVINKTNVSDLVKLTASATVSHSFTLTNGLFSTDPVGNPSFVLSSPVTASYSFAADKEIIGSVRRTSWVDGTATVFNAPNMQLTTNAGTPPTEVTVTMIPAIGSGDPTQTEREVKRKFNFVQTGGTGFTADIRYPYLASELNSNIEGNLVPWRLTSGEWNARLTSITRDETNNFVSTTGIPAAELTDEWKLADPNYTMNVTAFLRGAWNGTSMNTTLNIAGSIPLNQPYNITPFNYSGTESVASIPANVVDWVLIEHRKPISGLPTDALVSTISGRKAGFLLNNGIVVDLDGVTPIRVPISKQGSSFLVVRHRNHLGVLSNALSSNSTGTFTNDYSLLANAYKPVGAASDPLVLLAGGVEYGLWAGDASRNGTVNVFDVNQVRAAIAASLTGYQTTDLNLSNSINATDVNFSRSTISQSGTGSGTTARSSIISSNKNDTKKVVTSNLPDPVTEL
jgi:hypothetical protein